jgi:hypothetical protein
MAATHPAALGELIEWMRKDAEVNRRRGGGVLSVVAVAIFRLNQLGVRESGLAVGLPAKVIGPAPVQP